jgi:hypothetical protein
LTGGALSNCALYAKQIASTGCPSWARPAAALESTNVLVADHNTYISITFFFGTDSAGDETLIPTYAQIDASNDGSVNVIGGACLIHQYHLIVQRSLKFSDTICTAMAPAMNAPRKYFSALVKILHCWRDYHKEIRSRWSALFGPSDAAKFAGRRPPQAISNRWGSVEAGEICCLRPPLSQLKFALGPIVMPADPKPKPAAKQKLAALPAPSQPHPDRLVDTTAPEREAYGTEELALQATEHYRANQGKWRTDAGLALRDDIFLSVIVKVCNQARRPLTHFYHWLLKPVAGRDIDGDIRMPGKVAELVWGKAATILDELEETVVINY